MSRRVKCAGAGCWNTQSLATKLRNEPLWEKLTIATPEGETFHLHLCPSCLEKFGQEGIDVEWTSLTGDTRRRHLHPDMLRYGKEK